MKRYTYRTFGPHVVAMPPNIKLEVPAGSKPEPVLYPLHEKINDLVLEGWEYVSIIGGFPINIPQSTLAVSGRPQMITLTGVCVLMRKEK